MTAVERIDAVKARCQRGGGVLADELIDRLERLRAWHLLHNHWTASMQEALEQIERSVGVVP